VWVKVYASYCYVLAVETNIYIDCMLIYEYNYCKELLECLCISVTVKVKVRQSRYRPGVAQRVPVS